MDYEEYKSRSWEGKSHFYNICLEEHWPFIRQYLLAGWDVNMIARDKNTSIENILDMAKKNGLVETVEGWIVGSDVSDKGNFPKKSKL